MINSMELLLNSASRVNAKINSKVNKSSDNNASFEETLMGKLTDQAQLENSEANNDTQTELNEVNLELNSEVLSESEEDIVDVELVKETVIPELTTENIAVNSEEITTEVKEESKSSLEQVNNIIDFNTIKEPSKKDANLAISSLTTGNSDNLNENTVDQIYQSFEEQVFETKIDDLATKSHKEVSHDVQMIDVKKPITELAEVVEFKPKKDLNNSLQKLELLSMRSKKSDIDVKDITVNDSNVVSNVKLSNESEVFSLNSTEIAQEQTSIGVSSESIINQMSESITFEKLSDRQVINVKLKPDYLGNMSIKIEKTDLGTTLNIQVESESVKKALTENLDSVIEILGDKQISFNKVNITAESNNMDLSQQLLNHNSDSNSHNQPSNNLPKANFVVDSSQSNTEQQYQSITDFNNSRVSIYV